MRTLQKRRQFLESLGFAVASLIGSFGLPAARAFAQNPTPDLVVTMDPAAPSAEAFAVSAGRFYAVGSLSTRLSRI